MKQQIQKRIGECMRDGIMRVKKLLTNLSIKFFFLLSGIEFGTHNRFIWYSYYIHGVV